MHCRKLESQLQAVLFHMVISCVSQRNHVFVCVCVCECVLFLRILSLCCQILIKEVVRQKDSELEVGSVQHSAAPKGKGPDGENPEASGSSSPAEGSLKAERNGNTVEPHGGAPRGAFETRAFETRALANGKTQTLLKTSSKRKISQQKEKKATQMLAIVLGKQTHTHKHTHTIYMAILKHTFTHSHINCV